MDLEILFHKRDGVIERTIYACPCGKGTIEETQDYTEGHRDGEAWIRCTECNRKYRISYHRGFLRWTIVPKEQPSKCVTIRRRVNMNAKYRKMIADEFRNCVNNTISRISGEPTYRPFHTALLSEEAIFWSRFERSFSTSFGQRVIEEIAKLVALSNGATAAERQKVTYVDLDNSYISAIAAHMKSLREGSHQNRQWDATVQAIRNTQPCGETTRIRIISDLWWKKDGVDHYISLKTVKPNIDQTAVAKEDCLHLTLANPSSKCYFGLPYNPFGENKSDYAFNPPMGIFDFHHDSVVLIGKEMWDTIGGEGCYEEILEIAKEVGQQTKKSVAKMFK